MTLKKWEHYTNAPMFVLSALFLFAYSWQILAQTHITLCNWVINLVWVLYGIDYLVSLCLAHNRWAWFKSNVLLLITMLLPMFQPLRLLRFVPMLRMFNRSAGTATRGRITLYATSVVAMLIYVGALAEYSVEHTAPGATITSFPTSIWWAFVTVTTVGYGDVYPVTAVGRFIAVLLMITGIAVIGIVSAMISSWVIDQVNVRTHPLPSPEDEESENTDGSAANGEESASVDVQYHEALHTEVLSSSLNTQQSRIMQAELLRLTESVNRLNAEIERMHRMERRQHNAERKQHGNGRGQIFSRQGNGHNAHSAEPAQTSQPPKSVHHTQHARTTGTRSKSKK